MAKKGGGGGGGWLLLLIGGLLLLGVKIATAEEKSGTPVPADPGGQIDLIVEKLNEHFGKQWVQFALNVLKAYLEQTLPKPVVELANVVYAVEQQSQYIPMRGPEKKQAALNMLRG
jgi:hypothetical protein